MSGKVSRKETKKPTYNKKSYTKKSYGRAASKKKKTAFKKNRSYGYGNKLSGCARLFALAQYNPWANFQSAPCVPDFMAMPSKKLFYKIRGTFHAGTQGFGFISLNPYTIMNAAFGSGTNPNYCAPCWRTRATYSSNNTNLPACVDPGGIPSNVDAAYWDSEWSAQFMADNLEQGTGRLDYRCVGGGIKIQYAGAVMERKGQIILLEDPNNDETFCVEPLFTSTVALRRPEASYSALGDGEYAVLWHPRVMTDLDYASSWFANLANLAKYHVLLIIVDGCEPGTPFTFECIMHYELTGSQVPGRTKTDSDPSGLAAVQASISTKPSLQSPNVTAPMKLAEAEARLGHTSRAIYTSRGYIR